MKYKFNDTDFSIIPSEKNMVIYGVKTKKLYFLNQTSKHIFEQILQKRTIEDVINKYSELNQLEPSLIHTDFNNTLLYFCREGIIY